MLEAADSPGKRGRHGAVGGRRGVLPGICREQRTGSEPVLGTFGFFFLSKTKFKVEILQPDMKTASLCKLSHQLSDSPNGPRAGPREGGSAKLAVFVLKMKEAFSAPHCRTLKWLQSVPAALHKETVATAMTSCEQQKRLFTGRAAQVAQLRG